MRIYKAQLIIVLISMMGLSCVSQKTQVSRNLAALNILPWKTIYAATYRCEDFAKCINTLRASGKTASLRALQQYVQQHPSNANPVEVDKLMYVCRLILDNSEGWPPVGVMSSGVDSDIAKHFPYFPLALSDGIPFMLTDGYMVNGLMAENGTTDVNKCQGLPVLKGKIPVSGYRRAAEKLVESENFQRLYKIASDRNRMTQEILDQAGQ